MSRALPASRAPNRRRRPQRGRSGTRNRRRTTRTSGTSRQSPSTSPIRRRPMPMTRAPTQLLTTSMRHDHDRTTTSMSCQRSTIRFPTRGSPSPRRAPLRRRSRLRPRATYRPRRSQRHSRNALLPLLPARAPEPIEVPKVSMELPPDSGLVLVETARERAAAIATSRSPSSLVSAGNARLATASRRTVAAGGNAQGAACCLTGWLSSQGKWDHLPLRLGRTIAIGLRRPASRSCVNRGRAPDCPGFHTSRSSSCASR